MLTTKQVNQQFPMPQCSYMLKKGGPGGAYVKFAQVGDKITHFWECDAGEFFILSEIKIRIRLFTKPLRGRAQQAEAE